MQTLVLYDSSSSYTGAVYDHLNGFAGMVLVMCTFVIAISL